MAREFYREGRVAKFAFLQTKIFETIPDCKYTLEGHKLERSSTHIRGVHTHGMDMLCLADSAD
jgi:hypothetical protein